MVISRDNAEHYFWGTGCDGTIFGGFLREVGLGRRERAIEIGDAFPWRWRRCFRLGYTTSAEYPAIAFVTALGQP